MGWVSVILNVVFVFIIVFGFFYVKSLLKKLIFLAQKNEEFSDNLKAYKKLLQVFLDKNIYANDSGLTTLKNYTEEFIEYLDEYKKVFNSLGDFEYLNPGDKELEDDDNE